MRVLARFREHVSTIWNAIITRVSPGPRLYYNVYPSRNSVMSLRVVFPRPYYRFSIVAVIIYYITRCAAVTPSRV